ncbi:hypothetical protein [Aureivirga sp. CE67]|uniref:hypothetical protein n=1 Tax=Aureivirga sp. CE67 TaxID=1788983 RepID=UPI0018CB81F2|nr:hypothetical protein [Aureivirga sp. CE67]
MLHSSLISDLHYNEDHAIIYDLFETPKSSEKAILFRKEQTVDESFFLANGVVEVFAGIIEITHENEAVKTFDKGDLFFLEINSKFTIKAKVNTILRYTVFK